MILQINEDYRITTDSMNVVVEGKRIAQERAREPGAERWVALSYHSTLPQAGKWLLTHHVKVSHESGVDKLIATLERLSGQIEAAYRTVAKV